MRGCGKSSLTRIVASKPKFNRKIVFDLVEEWTGTHIVRSYQEFSNVWREVFNQDEYTIVVRFNFGTEEKIIQDTAAAIVTLIYKTGRESQLETCIIFEEAQFYFPLNYMHPTFKSLLTTGRHAYINVIANTQRPASIHKLLVSQSPEVYIGKLFEGNDIRYLNESVGSIAEDARYLEDLEFLYYQVGDRDSVELVDLKPVRRVPVPESDSGTTISPECPIPDHKP
jgi:hypothetical protein